jgi:hypothetical protein
MTDYAQKILNKIFGGNRNYRIEKIIKLLKARGEYMPKESVDKYLEELSAHHGYPMTIDDINKL